LAEGQARFSQKEFHHFLSQARGSLVEMRLNQEPRGSRSGFTEN